MGLRMTQVNGMQCFGESGIPASLPAALIRRQTPPFFVATDFGGCVGERELR